ncbi:MAG: hypothetical protein ABIS47_05330 [Acidimicrobiales bacterium]
MLASTFVEPVPAGAEDPVATVVATAVGAVAEVPPPHAASTDARIGGNSQESRRLG